MKSCAGWIVALTLLAPWPVGAFAQTDDGAVEEPVAIEPAIDDGGEPEAVALEDQDKGRPGRERERVRGARNRSVVLLEAFRDEVKRTLRADEETTGYLDDIFGEFIDEAQAHATQSATDRRENANEIRDLVAEMRDAQRDGDGDRVIALRENITELRTRNEDYAVAVDDLEDEVREVLTEEQFAQYERVARKYEARLAGSQKSAGDQQLQNIRRALAAVNLDSEQRERTRALFVDYARRIRRTRGEEEKTQAVIDELRDELFNELDDDQAEVFDRQLAEQERRQKGTPVERPQKPMIREGEVAADDEGAAEQVEEQGYEETGEEPEPPE